ncbi:sugar O-acyltransferase (sialic acid O-acetyltransferase NeuD family) [Dyadobacter jejuensis]|uniref:Sugar O-acyltransferase (Sialic acid O-acetyltransferase NeuD family) n=1 Tax=Dyadobacter jejuensis TaxID=1082580 RepID=A0A316AH38_9BACT|nr:acetyltransferase [Dyadobacter jejuensis]PWJ56951.1 sugar O-acyltransferase (sialic acid O-acetyltransferase NeuD family) [Dyadobacter jejuensis]
MLLYGGGGHGIVLLSLLQATGEGVSGVFDERPASCLVRGIPIFQKYKPSIFPHESILVAVGDNVQRKRIHSFLRHPIGTAIHPSAVVDTSVMIGPGTVVMHGAIVQAQTILGKQVIVNTGSRVDHGCSIGDFVHLAPGSVLCGGVVVGDNTCIGAGSIIVPGIRIGKDCLVAAGAVVTKNVAHGAVVRGNPARLIRS